MDKKYKVVIKKIDPRDNFGFRYSTDITRQNGSYVHYDYYWTLFGAEFAVRRAVKKARKLESKKTYKPDIIKEYEL